MSDCQRIDPLVTPYIDGELANADRRLVDDHLRACPPCHARVGAERSVRDLIQARKPALGAACAPESLRARCERLCALASAPTSAPGRTFTPGRTLAPFRTLVPRLVPLALAASLVLIVGGTFVYRLTDSSARVMAAELTADHVKCFAMNAVLGTHQAPTAVERVMAYSFGWQMRLPTDPARVGLELVGGRPCLYGEGKVAHIMYRHDGRPVSLFMLPMTVRRQQFVDVLGHEAAVWCVDNRTFVLIAREPRQQVQRLASFVQASLR